MILNHIPDFFSSPAAISDLVLVECYSVRISQVSPMWCRTNGVLHWVVSKLYRINSPPEGSPKKKFFRTTGEAAWRVHGRLDFSYTWIIYIYIYIYIYILSFYHWKILCIRDNHRDKFRRVYCINRKKSHTADQSKQYESCFSKIIINTSNAKQSAGGLRRGVCVHVFFGALYEARSPSGEPEVVTEGN